MYKMSSLIQRWLFSYSVLLLVFKDCQCFFLRHTQSGKCIAAGIVAWKDAEAYRYWAVMVENCLNVSAQFQYSNSEFLKNIKTRGTLMGVTDIRYKNRLTLYEGRNKVGRDFEMISDHYLKQTSAGSLIFYKAKQISCAQPSGDYVNDKREKCDDAELKFTFGSVVNYNTKMESVHCSSKQSMLFKRADYGDFSNGGTFDISATVDKKCSSLTTCKVKNLCGDIWKRSCEVTVDHSLLSPYCTYHTSKKLYMEYTCVDNYRFTITKGPNFRLSKTPGKGFIEIFPHGGQSWQKVDEKNWDEHRQKMLCQHLGFDETDRNVLDSKELGAGQSIASGDLICYGTRPGGTSCCIHLEPSTTLSRVNITYATCKICDKPLLENTSAFPDSVFSGVGSRSEYKDARFYNNGWCPLETGTKYLMIDLQEEYHITRVVTLGDFAQTKWSSSYSLKYSYDKSLVDKSSTVKIAGNKNGYQASTTTINIYNVRYIKIESTGNNEFCLRIEFCGEVQLPAPVQNLTAKQTNFSVELSWRIPSPKSSSYITHIIVYLDGNEEKKITRDGNEHKYILHVQKQKAEHIVGIQTQDNNLKRSTIIHKILTTKEAEKKCVDCPTCDVSHDNKTPLGFIIALVILSFCILLLLGVSVYLYTNQRRLRKHDFHQNHKRKKSREADKEAKVGSTEEHADGNELIGFTQTGPEGLDGSQKTSYEARHKCFDEQDSTNYEGSAKELSAYMSLNDNRETLSFYQPLQQPPRKRSDGDSVNVVEQGEEYVIPAIAPKSGGEYN